MEPQVQPILETQFKDLELRKCVLDAVYAQNYTKPTKIQAQTIPHILSGKDVLGQAETGSGKTAAFALPILSKLEFNQKNPEVLILAPTRELAKQVAEAFKTYGKNFKSLSVQEIYGGKSYTTQIKALKKNASVVVGTPGRVIDLIEKKVLKLDQIKHLVLDEADEMLNMGFLEDVKWILEQTPKSRQTILFSATMPKAIRQITQEYLNDPAKIRIEEKTATASTIEQVFSFVKPQDKLSALLANLSVENFNGVIIFAKTIERTNQLAEVLSKAGYKAIALNGEMQQSAREKAIERFKKGGFDIIVATDVAARGIDVERISHVINFDVPHNGLTYVHRIGRTGRAGRTGKAISFVENSETRILNSIEYTIKHKIQKVALPSQDEVFLQNTNKTIGQIKKALKTNPGLANYEAIINEFCQVENVSVIEVAAALMALMQKQDFIAQNDTLAASSDSRRSSAKPRFGDRDKKQGTSRFKDKFKGKGKSQGQAQGRSKSKGKSNSSDKFGNEPRKSFKKRSSKR